MTPEDLAQRVADRLDERQDCNYGRWGLIVYERTKMWRRSSETLRGPSELRKVACFEILIDNPLAVPDDLVGDSRSKATRKPEATLQRDKRYNSPSTRYELSIFFSASDPWNAAKYATKLLEPWRKK
jgi:hypothetical protein